MECEICGKDFKILFTYDGVEMCNGCLCSAEGKKRKPVYCHFCKKEIKSIYLKNGTKEKVVCYQCFETIMKGVKK